MSNRKHNQQVRFLTGMTEQANYKQTPIVKYQNNILISALPSLLEPAEFAKLVRRCPRHDPEQERLMRATDREHIISNVTEFFVPLTRAVHLEKRIARMMRHGYIGRDPRFTSGRGTAQMVEEMVNEVDKFDKNTPMSELRKRLVAARSSNRTATLIGVGGMGKTVTLQHILDLYPQVIVHSEYEGQKISHRQLVWLKIENPADASTRQLCFSFLQSVDEVMGTNYYKSYGKNGNASTNNAITGMSIVAAKHTLGLLVVDEIQNLSAARTGGAEILINFLVNMINRLNIPIILVGTPEAEVHLSKNFRITRRVSGGGEINWPRYKKNDSDWVTFIETMWEYQYTREEVPLTPEMKDIVYEFSQGIPDAAVKIYIATQYRVITNGKEFFTLDTIRSVAADKFQRMDMMLQHARSGNQTGADAFGIGMESLDEIVRLAQQTIIEKQLRGQLKQKSTQKKSGGKRARRRADGVYSPYTLMGIVQEGKNSGIDGYEALNQAGYVKPLAEFWAEGEVPWV